MIDRWPNPSRFDYCNTVRRSRSVACVRVRGGILEYRINRCFEFASLRQKFFRLMNASMDGRTDRTDGCRCMKTSLQHELQLIPSLMYACMRRRWSVRLWLLLRVCVCVCVCVCLCVCLLACCCCFCVGPRITSAQQRRTQTKPASRWCPRKTIRQSQLSLRSYSEASKRPRPSREAGAQELPGVGRNSWKIMSRRGSITRILKFIQVRINPTD